MSRFRITLLVVTLSLLTPAVLYACMWDYDTLQMERARFPSTLEVITGKFLRHSSEFYQWRVEDRTRRLESEADNLALYDDLAVAYDKLGQHDKAIETILVKNRKKPNQYETLANLGTFYIHAGQWEKSIDPITQALAINPDAHFGREKYQKYLIEYVLESHRQATSLPAAGIGIAFVAVQRSVLAVGNEVRLPLSTKYRETTGLGDFYAFILSKEPNGNTLEDRQAAIKGVLGMMRFAHHDSPILLEALGDLLGSGYDTRDAKQLAARAYLKAEMHTKDLEVKHGYHSLATSVLTMQMAYSGGETMKLSDLEASFKAELNDADQWYAKLHDDECRWIREGKNPEAEFNKLYALDPAVQSPDDNKTIRTLEEMLMWTAVIVLIVLAVAVGSVVVLLIFLIRRYRRKRLPALSALDFEECKRK